MKNFKIFTEGGSLTGLGHVSRCSALYDEIESRGFNVILYINGNIDNITFLSNYNIVNCNWLDTIYISDNVSNSDFCIVDSYLANKKQLNQIANNSKSTLFIDDNNRIDYPKGFVVNPSLSVDSIRYPDNDNINYLLGPDYIILRTPFKNFKKTTLNIITSNVLIITGGSDMKNITPDIIQSICKANSNVHFDIIIGSKFENVELIRTLITPNIKLHFDLNAYDMQLLMTQSDFAISTSGQTIYELLSTEVPFLPIKIAENQNNNLNGLKKYFENIKYIDIDSDDWVSKLSKYFKLFSTYKHRMLFNDSLKNIVDGNGTKRIIDIFTNTQNV